MIVKKVITKYYCGQCLEDGDTEEESELEESEINKCVKCGDEACEMCIRECGEDDHLEGCKVKGCHQIFCRNCSDLSPWDRWYTTLCKDCIKRQNVGYWYGPEAWEKGDDLKEDES
jgi:hypothetical protein